MKTNKYFNPGKSDNGINILITGGSGMVGKRLSEKLHEKLYKTAILGRKKPELSGNRYWWDISNGEIEEGAVENADYIIHLAGAGIADKRWSSARKKEIIDSRVKTCELLHKKLNETQSNIKAFVSASGVGYYGAINSDKVFTEQDKAGKDYVADVCVKWEKAADNFQKSNIRTVKLRIGIVLSQKGGALEKMIMPVKFGFGSPIGNGKQYMPWVHIDDLCDMFIKAVEDDQIKGVYNAVASEHATNRAFTKTCARVLKKPFFMPNVPACVMKIGFGEMSKILLKGSRVSNKKIIDTGFVFNYPDLLSALSSLL